jgi:hypothetical protein
VRVRPPSGLTRTRPTAAPAVLPSRLGPPFPSPSPHRSLPPTPTQVRSAIAARSFTRFFELYASAPNLGRALLDVHAPAMRWHALNTLARAYRPNLPLARLAAAAGFVPRGGGGGAAGGGGRGGAPLPGRRTVVFEGECAAAASEAAGVAAAEEWARSCGAVITRGAAPGTWVGFSTFAQPHAPHLRDRTCPPSRPSPPPAPPLPPLPAADGELLLDCKACSARGALHPPPQKDKVAHGDANLDINDFLAKIGV